MAIRKLLILAVPLLCSPLYGYSGESIKGKVIEVHNNTTTAKSPHAPKKIYCKVSWHDNSPNCTGVEKMIPVGTKEFLECKTSYAKILCKYEESVASWAHSNRIQGISDKKKVLCTVTDHPDVLPPGEPIVKCNFQ